MNKIEGDNGMKRIGRKNEREEEKERERREKDKKKKSKEREYRKVRKKESQCASINISPINKGDRTQKKRRTRKKNRILLQFFSFS